MSNNEWTTELVDRAIELKTNNATWSDIHKAVGLNKSVDAVRMHISREMKRRGISLPSKGKSTAATAMPEDYDTLKAKIAVLEKTVYTQLLTISRLITEEPTEELEEEITSLTLNEWADYDRSAPLMMEASPTNRASVGLNDAIRQAEAWIAKPLYDRNRVPNFDEEDPKKAGPIGSHPIMKQWNSEDPRDPETSVPFLISRHYEQMPADLQKRIKTRARAEYKAKDQLVQEYANAGLPYE